MGEIYPTTRSYAGPNLKRIVLVAFLGHLASERHFVIIPCIITVREPRELMPSIFSVRVIAAIDADCSPWTALVVHLGLPEVGHRPNKWRDFSYFSHCQRHNLLTCFQWGCICGMCKWVCVFLSSPRDGSALSKEHPRQTLTARPWSLVGSSLSTSLPVISLRLLVCVHLQVFTLLVKSL